MNVCIYVCMCVYVCMYVCIYIYIIYIYISPTQLRQRTFTCHVIVVGACHVIPQPSCHVTLVMRRVRDGSRLQVLRHQPGEIENNVRTG